MDLEFRYEMHKDSEGDQIRLFGNIDSQCEQQLKDLYARITGKRILLDFSNTVRINSMGIAFLLRMLKQVKAEKRSQVMITGENKTNALLFKMTGIYLLTEQGTAPDGRG